MPLTWRSSWPQMKPNPFLDMGITVGKINAADQLDGREQLLVMA